MHSVKRPKQRDIQNRQKDLKAWTQWRTDNIDNTDKLLLANLAVQYCKGNITEKMLFTQISQHKGLMEKAQHWEMPKWTG